ncbi:patatin-like phospholipase family protein [Erythrobacter colymbi]|uniref:patatin-like phospholipase family protein n=1 Tax=Erythrobacter colymbi TaxID=1161202 RepID=UPI000A3C9E04|nr:patatin-like phospholipase family protein [Erythrobacter colymbi]
MADNPISLCLSGGGLRATLFHLGVVRALREHKMGDARLIDRIGEVYAVSGGSILAAHMLLKWDLYTGDDDAFAEAQREIYALAQRNIRDRVLRRAVLSAIPIRLRNLVSGSPLCGRTHWLMGEYDHLLKKARIDEAVEAHGPKPRFHFLSTNFRTGELCSFSGNSFEVEGHDGGLSATSCGHLTLSRAVAASSAFPPMFPPMLLDDKLLARPRDNAFLLPLQLSDGGVYDNLGIEKFWRNLDRDPGLAGTLIVSNAGSPFRAEASRTFSGIFSRNIRASDILMRRIGKDSEAEIAASERVDDVVVSLTDAVPGGPLDPAVQQTLRLVRTDLDRFRPELADLLVEQGAAAATQRFAKRGWEQSGPPPSWPGDAAARQRQKDIASRAEARSFVSLPFDWRDWKPLLALWVIAGVMAWTALSLGQAYFAAKAARNAAQQETIALLGQQSDKLAAVTDALRNGRIEQAREILAIAISETQKEQETKEQEVKDQAIADASLLPLPAAEAPPLAAPAPPPPVKTQAPAVPSPLRVYIQFAGRLTREQIEGLNRSLKANGWNTQGDSGERIASAYGFNEVRYGGNNAAAAAQLAAAINASKLTSRKLRTVRVQIVGDRNLEVWISK